jgi:hypothetical protein
MPGAVAPVLYFAGNCARRNATWPSRKCALPPRQVRFLTRVFAYP